MYIPPIWTLSNSLSVSSRRGYMAILTLFWWFLLQHFPFVCQNMPRNEKQDKWLVRMTAKKVLNFCYVFFSSSVWGKGLTHFPNDRLIYPLLPFLLESVSSVWRGVEPRLKTFWNGSKWLVDSFQTFFVQKLSENSNNRDRSCRLASAFISLGEFRSISSDGPNRIASVSCCSCLGIGGLGRKLGSSSLPVGSSLRTLN